MKQIDVKPLDEKRFNAFAGASRSPAAAYVSYEIRLYTNDEETIMPETLEDTFPTLLENAGKMPYVKR